MAKSLGEIAVDTAEKLGKNVPKILSALKTLSKKVIAPVSTVWDGMYLDYVLDPEMAKGVGEGVNVIVKDREEKYGLIMGDTRARQLKEVMDGMDSHIQRQGGAKQD